MYKRQAVEGLRDEVREEQSFFDNTTFTEGMSTVSYTHLQTAQSSSASADEEYLNATSEIKALAGEVKSASRDTVDGLNMVSNGLHGFASGTLQGSFEGIQNMLTGLSKLNIGGKVGDAISRMSETLSSAGVIGQIISAILSILDLLLSLIHI